MEHAGGGSGHPQDQNKRADLHAEKPQCSSAVTPPANLSPHHVQDRTRLLRLRAGRYSERHSSAGGCGCHRARGTFERATYLLMLMLTVGFYSFLIHSTIHQPGATSTSA